MALTKRERDILDAIKIPSESDPSKPEFPSDNPHFPATPTFQIAVPGSQNVWIKDESYNPTGTHKDRMAWEMVVTYRDLLKAKAEGRITKLPTMSIISSGSAAFAIQYMLRKYHLPSLHVVVDYSIHKETKHALRSVGCAIFETDLSKRPLTTEMILRLTNNPDGIDITSDDRLGPNTRFYDWMTYEILNSSPEYCFIPYGTGNLYENILNILHEEMGTFLFHDKRFRGDLKTLSHCHFIGVTTNNPQSKADKLYSPHLPFTHVDEQWLSLLKKKGHCGKLSDVYVVEEKYLDKAMEIALNQGIHCEPSGIAGLAMLLQMEKEISKHAKILIVNTGKTKYEIIRGPALNAVL